MLPNIFLDYPTCDEDLFSVGLAYVLNLFPSLGAAVAQRIAVMSGRHPDYFGDFESCEYVASEYLGAHRASRPDLKLLCSKATIYFENKLNSPLNLRQVRNHSSLAQADQSGYLVFVSNLRHNCPGLRSIPCYVHPSDRDHFLWVDLIPVLQLSGRKSSAEKRLLEDFQCALRLYGMQPRTLPGAQDSLYTPSSDSCHLALNQLAAVLKRIGFIVNRKSEKETTLRVYPSASRFPLLNPCFMATAVAFDRQLDVESLVITTLSRTHDRALASHLGSFPSSQSCRFFGHTKQVPGYTIYGHFVVPVNFLPQRNGSAIDFSRLEAPLQSILVSLGSPPTSKT